MAEEGSPTSGWEERTRLLPFASHFCELDGGHRLHYLDEGRGKIALLLHGNPTWCFLWRDLVGELRTFRRVLVPDHLGCGHSDRPRPGDYDFTLEQRVRDLDQFLGAVAPGEVVDLVVHDWGGLIGFGWGVRHPGRIRSLVVLNSAAFTVPESSRLHWVLRWCRRSPIAKGAMRRWNAFLHGALWLGARKRLPAWVKRGYRAPYRRAADREAIVRFVEDIPLGPADPSYRFLRETEDLLPQLRDRPLLLCWGGRDFIFDGAFLERWRRAFPEAEVALFPEAGHYVLEDAGKAALERICKFLERVDA
ncbi:MAG: alpha/beta fold hydrolase [Acidobacteriota bacterium]